MILALDEDEVRSPIQGATRLYVLVSLTVQPLDPPLGVDGRSGVEGGHHGPDWEYLEIAEQNTVRRGPLNTGLTAVPSPSVVN